MMQKIFSYKYLFLGLLISVLIPLSFAYADSPGDTSIGIPDPYTGGPVTVTVEALDESGNPVTVTITVTLTPSVSCTTSVFSASPNPIVSAGSTGVTTITANATCAYDIRVGSTAGSLFAQGGPGSSSSITGNWVTNGMVFYLQKRNDTSAGGTLATLTVNLVATPPTPTNFVATTDNCGTGRINLTWSSATGATSYALRRNGVLIYTGASTSYLDSGLSAGTTYSYTLTASNAAGTSAQASTSGTAPLACVLSAPDVTFSANPTFMTSLANSTLLSWSATNNPTSCTASANPFNSNWNGSKAIPSGSQTISGLAVGTYTFSIYCTNTNGNSSIKNVAITVSAAASMSGSLTASNCTIASGASSCNSTLNWTTANPVAVSSITTPTNITVATGNSGSTSYPVSGGTRTFYLYNNGILLDQKTATASCTAGTTWDGTKCAPISGCVAAGTGTGLTAKYYDGMDLINLITTRTDSTINFNPADSLGTSYAGGGDTFSVAWEGKVEPRCSETYTFYTNSDDGVRLWVNGIQLVNNWTNHGPTENSGTIVLTGGTKYDMKMEFFENTGGAVAQLSWSSLSTPKAIVPQTQLYPICIPPTLKTATSGFSLTSSASSSIPGLTQDITVSPGQLFYSYVDYGTKTLDGTIRGPYPYLANPAQNAFDRFLGWTNDPGTAARFDYVNISSAPTTPGTYTYYTDIFNSTCPPAGPSAIGTVTVSNPISTPTNPIMVCAPDTTGTATLNVSSAVSYDIRIGSPSGPALVTSQTAGTRSHSTGDIVTNGMTFYLVSAGTTNVLGSVTITHTSTGCPTAVANISADSTNIPYDTATNITWSSSNATSCSVSPASWTGLSGTQSTGNLTSSRTYTVSCNPAGAGSSASVTVNVQAQPKSLTVIKSGQGTITSGPAGINCGSDCTEDYAADSTVVLTATPSSGRIFTGWGGDGASCGKNTTCSIIMNSPKSVIANFAVDPNYKEF